MDWRYIQEELAPLCEAKEEPEILDRLISLKRELEAYESEVSWVRH
jgi:hypothetical protein